MRYGLFSQTQLDLRFFFVFPSYLSSLSDIVCDILINNGIIEKLIQFFSTFTEIDFSSEAFQKKNNFAIHIDGINLLTTLW